MPGVAAPKEEKTKKKRSLKRNFRKHGSLSAKVFEMITTVPTIGCLVGLRLGEAQPFHFGAGRLPETRRTGKKNHHQPFQNRKPLGATRCHRLLLKQWNFCWEQQECCLHRELGATFLLEVKETPFEDDDEDQRQDEQDAEDGDQTFLPSRHLHCGSKRYIYFILHSLVIFSSGLLNVASSKDLMRRSGQVLEEFLKKECVFCLTCIQLIWTIIGLILLFGLTLITSVQTLPEGLPLIECLFINVCMSINVEPKKKKKHSRLSLHENQHWRPRPSWNLL